MSFNYFDEKPKIAKKQSPKRKAEKVVKKESLKIIFEQFLESKIKQNLRNTTLNQHLILFNDLEKFQSSKGSSLYLIDITTDFISDYVYWMKNEAIRFEGHNYKPTSAQTVGYADATIESRLKYLRTFINWCLKQELLLKDPFLKFEGFKKDAKQIEILTRDEINQLLAVAQKHSKQSFKHFRDYVLLHLLVDGMLRITEALTLSPSDIDHANKTLIIQSDHAKSRKARVIPLSNKTYRLLLQLLEENEAFDDDVDDLVFLSLSGRILNKNNMLRDLRKYAVEAKITKRFYLHLLRHSAATHYLSSSGDIESLRKILGHADLRTVLTYAHLADDTVQQKHAKSGFFGSENMIIRKRNNKRK